MIFIYLSKVIRYAVELLQLIARFIHISTRAVYFDSFDTK